MRHCEAAVALHDDKSFVYFMRFTFVACEMVKWVLDEDGRLERRLRELLERQRLSRFDTLMFPLYPGTIAAFTALASALWQIHALREFEVLSGLTAADVVVWLAFLVAVLILGLVLFGHAYASDSMRERVDAAGLLALGAVVIGGLFSLLIGVVTLFGPVRGISISLPLQGYEMWLLGFAFFAMLAWMFLVVSVAFEVQDHVHSLVAPSRQSRSLSQDGI
jgi:hypothetical protein